MTVFISDLKESGRMGFVCRLIGCTLMLVTFASGSAPPKMLSTYFNTQYVKPGNIAKERCQADGDPKPTYIWRKDGTVLSNHDQYEINSNTGEIKIKRVTVVNGEGTYQCSANNSQGTSLSGFWEVKIASLSGFNEARTHNPKVTEYSYFSMPCKHQPSSVPASKLDWLVGAGDNVAFPKTLEDKRRIVVDDDGTIHFVFVKMSDNLNNPYRCQLFNKIISIKAVSLEKFNLNVTSVVPEVTYKPILKYSKSVEGTIGSKVILLCIFAGNPIPDVVWAKDGVGLPDESSLSDGTPRYKVDPEDSTGRKLILSRLEINDEGEYTCLANNTYGSGAGIIRLKVTGPPQWRQPLSSIRIPVGATAEFRCDTISLHASSSLPMWMKNGEPIIGCGVKKFWCGDGTRCYDYNKKCDSRSDCPGVPSADERYCPVLATCTEGQFSCGGGECKTSSEVIRCDGIEQCQNGGDESVRHCGCKVNTDFMCADLRTCVPASARCNKSEDCADRSDEERCEYDTEKVIDERFNFTADLRQFTIPNVTKTDTMCVQCLVYNFREYGPNPKPDIVGIAFGDACLTVFDPIKILSGLPQRKEVKPGDIINFTISVQAGGLETGNVQYDWYIGGRKYRDHFQTGNWSRIIKLSKNNSNIVIDTSNLTSQDDMLFPQLMGNLMVKVYNEYDQITMSTELVKEIIKLPSGSDGNSILPTYAIVIIVIAGVLIAIALI